jgi:hypothetical protein
VNETMGRMVISSRNMGFLQQQNWGFRCEVDINHSCPFPIGWLMKKEGFDLFTPLTTGK